MLTGYQIIKKFLAFYGTRMFITAFISPASLSLVVSYEMVNRVTAEVVESSSTVRHCVGSSLVALTNTRKESDMYD